MSTEFHDTQTTLGVALTRTAEAITGKSITLRELFELVGEHGLLLFCTLLTIPFLLPVSIPGVSTVFGLVIILIGVGVTLNRLPWLPNRLMNRSIARENLVPALEKGARFFSRLERWMKPRLMNLTTGAVANRLNGVALTFSGVLLIFPLGLIPFSNTLPALAILLLAVGMLQRDGFAIVAGYIAMIATIVYFSVLGLAVVLGGQMLLG